jgi:hypothetical protein
MVSKDNSPEVTKLYSTTPAGYFAINTYSMEQSPS